MPQGKVPAEVSAEKLLWTYEIGNELRVAILDDDTFPFEIALLDDAGEIVKRLLIDEQEAKLLSSVLLTAIAQRQVLLHHDVDDAVRSIEEHFHEDLRLTSAKEEVHQG